MYILIILHLKWSPEGPLISYIIVRSLAMKLILISGLWAEVMYATPMQEAQEAAGFCWPLSQVKTAYPR